MKRADGTIKFIPVALTKNDGDHRPQFLRKYAFFRIDSNYEDLYRLLTNQPKILKPDIGKRLALPYRARRSDYRNFVWNVPARNNYFTGREKYLIAIHEALTGGGTAALTQAIKGLGGIGKSDTAIEYAYKYRGY